MCAYICIIAKKKNNYFIFNNIALLLCSYYCNIKI